MQAWESFVTAQEKLLGKETVDKWLRPLKVVDFDACNLYLEAKDSFQLSWFEEQIRSKLRTELRTPSHKPIKVHLTLAADASLEKPVAKKSFPKGPEATKPPPPSFSPDPLEEWATLEQFLPGRANAVLMRFLENLSTHAEHNPLLLYGGCGLGKTHLLMALARALRQKNKNALYVRAETFTDHVVSAIRSGEMHAFRKSYRSVDCLLVDDIHLLARKMATQEEFFHTFNALHTTGRQIILSSAVAPSQLQEIEGRLTSRFEWGISFRLEPLESPELRQLLEVRCKHLDFPLEPSLISFLLNAFGHQQKALLKALDTLILRDHLAQNTPLTLESAQHYLSSLLEEKQKSLLTPEKILEMTARFYDVRREEILGKTRTQECALPRQMAMYLCRTELKLPYARIGEIFSRDHSTVMASVGQVQKNLDAKNTDALAALATIRAHFEKS